jgi:hypothetical protein
VKFSAQSVGGMFGVYFAATPPTSYAEVMASDKDAFNRFFHAMLDAGVYLAPSAFEAGFVSAAHTEADIAATSRKIVASPRKMKKPPESVTAVIITLEPIAGSLAEAAADHRAMHADAGRHQQVERHRSGHHRTELGAAVEPPGEHPSRPPQTGR